MAGSGAGAVRSYSDPRTSQGLGSIWVNLWLLREFIASLTPGRKLPLAATRSFFFTSVHKGLPCEPLSPGGASFSLYGVAHFGWREGEQKGGQPGPYHI